MDHPHSRRPVGLESLGGPLPHQPRMVTLEPWRPRQPRPRPLRRPHEPSSHRRFGIGTPSRPNGPELPPPDSYEKPLDGRQKNQKPADGGPAGFSTRPRGENAGLRGPHRRPHRSAPSPPRCFRRFRRPDDPRFSPDRAFPTPPELRRRRRANPTCGTWCRRISRTPAGCSTCTTRRSRAAGDVQRADRLRFVAAAEHARAIGTTNPCGLFVRLVRGGLWSFVTQDDEDAANAAAEATPVREAAPNGPLRRSRWTRGGGAFGGRPLVRAVRAAVSRARYRGDAFPLLKATETGVDAERWDAAAAELERDARPEPR